LAGRPEKQKRTSSSHSSDLLHKIGAAYNGYRHGVMELVASTQDLLASAARPSEVDLHKLAAVPVSDIFTPLSFRYLRDAFKDEMGELKTAKAEANVERGLPSRNTSTNNPSMGGLTS
jgi:hypothetical protein